MKSPMEFHRAFLSSNLYTIELPDNLLINKNRQIL